MKLNIYDLPEEVLDNLATYFVATANSVLADQGKFSVALSGGSSPKKLYELLASRHSESVNWDRVFFFFGDERYVPVTDPESNFRMARMAMFEPLQIKDSNIFPFNTSLSPDASATDYMDAIVRHFAGKESRFDLVLLGLGDNSHTASLFPHTPVLQEKEATVKAVFLQDQQVYRITFTAPLINLAKRVAFLVYGEGKAAAVFHIIEDQQGDIQEYPARLVNPVDGQVEWFLDKAAARQINS